MKKFRKITLFLAMAAVLIMQMPVYAATGASDTKLNESATGYSDTSSIDLYKNYLDTTGVDDNESPAEDFEIKVEKYSTTSGTVASMPSFAASSYTISADSGEAEGDAKNCVTLNIPSYSNVGDYWYKLTETNGNTAGVIYGTNDGTDEDLNEVNNAHDGIYYLHVQVTVVDGSRVRTVTLHQDAPNTDGTPSGTKVTDIENKYYAGQLQIVKELSGNAADPDELFKVAVEFTKPAGQNMNSDITYENYLNSEGTVTAAATSIGWTTGDTKKVEFYVKGGTTVTFNNIPYGVTYTVEEEKVDGYSHSFAYGTADEAASFDGITCAADTVTEEATTGTDDAKWAAASASGSISDALDEVTITNTKNTTIDIGVMVKNAPFAVMLILAAGMMILFVARRRRMIEE